MPTEHPSKLYGRHKGRPLSARRTALLSDAYPELAIDLSRPASAEPGALFDHLPATVGLEIGFGGGEHLIGEAQRAPDAGFIGVEPFVNGMAKAVAAVVDGGLANVRLFQGDATDLLDWLLPSSLVSVDLLYPDPWPKRRHWKRRFIGPANLDRLARVLATGGVLRVATDIASYTEWTLMHVANRDDFAWIAERADDWRLPFPDWISTRYEQKAIRAGRIPTYMEFRRA